MKITWDHAKDLENRKKHGWSLEDGAALLRSERPIFEVFDDTYEGGEERFIVIGAVPNGVITAVYAEYEDEHIRVISVRDATKREKDAFLLGARLND